MRVQRSNRPVMACGKAVALLVCGPLLVVTLEAQQAPEGDPVTRFRATTEVVASRLADDAVAAGRRELILDREEIAELPVSSVHELLAVLPGVGLTRRGARGVQGDLNLRGGTFEQALVLLNGMRVNNPQTGHHNLDLFIPLAAVDRVEVLYGPGSAVHGPDAFGGAINIVTGVPERSAYLRVGENHLTGGGVASWIPGGAWAALEREVHTGFRDNTEADVNQGAGGWSWSAGERAVNLAVAAGRRRFGAHAFYSSRFPDEREKTSGQVLTASAEMPLVGARLGLGLRLDHHEDDFVLDRNRPEWFRNRHETQGALLDLDLSGSVGSWDWVAGVELARDEIDSSNLGRHHRARGGAFVEAGRFTGPLTYAVQLRVDHQDVWGWVDTVALGGAWEIADGWRLRAHRGQSFRAPSFTDLYYTSPATEGNPELEPEQGHTTELGLEVAPWSLSVFERRASPIIDYVLDDDGVWRAANLGEVRTRGLEGAVFLPSTGRLQWQRLGFVYLDSAIGVDAERSAYALAHPRIEAAWTGALDLGGDWGAGWAVRWRDPVDRGSWYTVDAELSRRVGRGLWLVCEGSNIMDREISELHGIPLPGRWLSLSVSYREERP